jgi:hypothetical protein
LNGSAISNTSDPTFRIAFAISAFLPFAAIVRAARQMDLAPSGNILPLHFSETLRGFTHRANCTVDEAPHVLITGQTVCSVKDTCSKQ